MASLQNMYNPDAEARADFAPLPSGEYVARIIESDMKPVNPPKVGEYLELTHEVVDGEFKGRRVWARLNLDNPNPKAVEIANRDFAAIRAATGVNNPRDSFELHNKPMLIRVEFIPAGTMQKNGKATTKDGNEIRAWKRLDGATPAAAAPAESGMKTPPWQRVA